jgi:hypothetical protein
VVLVCAVADVIAHKYTGIAAVTISALLVRQSIHQLCENIWCAQPEQKEQDGQ